MKFPVLLWFTLCLSWVLSPIAWSDDTGVSLVPETSSGENPQPTPSPSAETPPSEVVVVKHKEPDFPDLKRKKYRELRSHWGVQVVGSGSALGTQQFATASRPIAGSIIFEYQPDFIQQYGVFSFGPSINMYPVIPLNSDVPNAESIWSLGAQLRYQAKYKPTQFIVPYVGYAYEYLTYHLVSEGEGAFPLSGPIFGLSILLNVLDPYGEAAFYYDSGVLRTYLVAEGRALSGSDANLSVSGISWFFGVRVEF